MAKGAANENALGSLHSKVTAVFIKVLATYALRLEAIDKVDLGDIEDEMIRELFNENAMPNPAMLGAITKFLKDNAISFDTEALAELSDQERRLAERRKNRGNLTSLTTLKVVGE